MSRSRFPASPDGIRNVHLSNLKVAGDMTYYAKKPEDPVEVVFVSKETRIPIYLVGDTALLGRRQELEEREAHQRFHVEANGEHGPAEARAEALGQSKRPLLAAGWLHF